MTEPDKNNPSIVVKDEGDIVIIQVKDTVLLERDILN